jgi:hypothetical protein
VISLTFWASQSPTGLHLSQRQYAIDLLKRAGMTECHATTTPVDTYAKLSTTSGAPVSNPSYYRIIVGALQYLTLTRQDLSYVVQQVCLYMHALWESHLALVKHILWYIKGTLNFGLHIGVSDPCFVTTYSDADWAGCPDTRCSVLCL